MNRMAAHEDPAVEEASAWVARLNGAEVNEADGLAFDAWLSAAPANRAAYRAVIADWQEFDRNADEILAELESRRRRDAGRTNGWRRGWLAAGGVALAATFALAVLPPTLRAPPEQVYATERAQHRKVTLADGSTIDMDAETRLRVTLSRGKRQVVLDGGQAIFDVASDKARPFTVAAANHVVRVVGTQFEVRSRARALTVTVARGRVEVRPSAAEGGRTYVLTPGDRLAIGPAGDEAVRLVDPQETFSWRAGRLVYRDQPLGDVVADLNREFVQQIQIGDPALAKIPITGVIVLDDPRAVTTRLSLMLPIKTVPSNQGLTLLRK